MLTFLHLHCREILQRIGADFRIGIRQSINSYEVRSGFFPVIAIRTDQTTIDSRSKLMVELREDILDQVTRLYFERRRLQLELRNDLSIEPPVKIEKQLRLAELTALIDSYTGGQFGKSVNTKK